MRIHASMLLLLFCGILATGCQRPKEPDTTQTLQDSQNGGESQPAQDGGDTSDSETNEAEPIPIPPPSGDLILNGMASTVRLGSDGQSGFDGSGVIVHRDADQLFVLTVAHAATAGIQRVELFTAQSGRKPAANLDTVKVVSMDKDADLALLQVTLDADIDIMVVPIAKPDSQPQFGYSVGCGGGKPPSVLRERIIRASERKIKLPGGTVKRFMWETKNAQEQGRSGGPLLNANGCLLGVALGKYEGLGYYSHLREISGYLIDNGLSDLVICGSQGN